MEAIIREIAVLIARLTVSGGSRVPLGHLTDTVFFRLARELEAQGVPRRIVADSFGVTYRTYQRRMRRFEESSGERQRTLWQAVNEFLQESGKATRHRIFERFQYDDPEALGAVLSDLVQCGRVFRAGSQGSTLYVAAQPAPGSLVDEDRNTREAFRPKHSQHPLEKELLAFLAVLQSGADALAARRASPPEEFASPAPGACEESEQPCSLRESRGCVDSVTQPGAETDDANTVDEDESQALTPLLGND